MAKEKLPNGEGGNFPGGTAGRPELQRAMNAAALRKLEALGDKYLKRSFGNEAEFRAALRAFRSEADNLLSKKENFPSSAARLQMEITRLDNLVWSKQINPDDYIYALDKLINEFMFEPLTEEERNPKNIQ